MGILISSLYFILFQMGGVCISFVILKNLNRAVKLLVGSVFGSLFLQWIPLILSIFFGFSIFTHILSLLILFGISLGAYLKFDRTDIVIKNINIKLVACFFIISTLIVALMIHSLRSENGSVYSSQSTYGDMCMHLSFINGIANNMNFPFEYPFFPQNVLSYPFLCDSISSSMFVLNAPIIFSYLLPMLFATLQVVGGAILFFRAVLKTNVKVIVATILFLFNGGFGFTDFISNVQNDPSNFTRMFTEFYQTPTNNNADNIRWSNVIVDMLVPQRATLFGWALLFTCLVLLYYAISKSNRQCFVVTGIIAGLMPMVHTHSFLVLVLISAAWFLIDLMDKSLENHTFKWVKISLLILPFAMTLIQFVIQENRSLNCLMYIPLIFVLAITICLIYFVFLQKFTNKNVINWIIYIAIAGVLSIPQLCFWTFSQSQGETFVRSYFNWANLSDNYLWFYIRNIGIVALFYIPTVISAKKAIIKLISPVFLIMLIAELMVFQPNVYDNNKLIYIAYFLICPAVANFAVDAIKLVSSRYNKVFLSVSFLFLASISAVLTMGREFVSNYELINGEHIEAGKFIKYSVDKEAVFLTYNNHNNVVCAFAGRDIVCGSSSYLYYHGIDYASTEAQLKLMFEDPEQYQYLYEQHSVDYVFISDWEKANYNIDIDYMNENFIEVYANTEVTIYKVLQD